jgi:hypothetical protein
MGKCRTPILLNLFSDYTPAAHPPPPPAPSEATPSNALRSSVKTGFRRPELVHVLNRQPSAVYQQHHQASPLSLCSVRDKAKGVKPGPVRGAPRRSSYLRVELGAKLGSPHVV